MPLDQDPDFRDTKALVLDAVRVLFGRTVAKFSPLEHQVGTTHSTWFMVNGFKESMSERWVSTQ